MSFSVVFMRSVVAARVLTFAIDRLGGLEYTVIGITLTWVLQLFTVFSPHWLSDVFYLHGDA